MLIRVPAWRRLAPADLHLDIKEGNRHARVVSVRAVDGSTLAAELRAGILPGPVGIEANAKGFEPARARIELTLNAADRYGDGTPDVLRLDDAADREAFRRWFTFLAEAQWLRRERLPAEIVDCAALARFAYRQALHEHDGAWAAELDLPFPPPGPSVQKYAYPFTPLGADVFRVQPGPFSAEDLSNGAFAQFADVQTLRRENAHFIGFDLRRARPGDLLFYRQLEQDLPFHMMIFLGASHFELASAGAGNISDAWVIYHTGPFGGGKGEIRRVRVSDLLNHPQPRWRPVQGNPNFLGVSRWNILREGE